MPYGEKKRHRQTDGRTDRIALSISCFNVLMRDKNMPCLVYMNVRKLLWQKSSSTESSRIWKTRSVTGRLPGARQLQTQILRSAETIPRILWSNLWFGSIPHAFGRLWRPRHWHENSRDQPARQRTLLHQGYDPVPDSSYRLQRAERHGTFFMSLSWPTAKK